MKKIKELVDLLDEELDGAKTYAEKHVEYKADKNNKWAIKFQTMAETELEHAMAIHELVVEEINKVKEVYTPPQDMLDKWDKEHKEYIEKVSWIKTMLTL